MRGLEKNIQNMVRYISGISFKILINGYEINTSHMSFTKTDGSEYAMAIDSHYMQGWVRPYIWGEDGYDGDHIRIYVQERFVKKEYRKGFNGILHVESSAIDLRSPDRKDVIYNNKYIDLMEDVNGYFKKILLNIVKNGTNEAITKYDEVIVDKLSINDYREYVDFMYSKNSLSIEMIQEMMRKAIESKSKENMTLDEIAIIQDSGASDYNMEDLIIPFDIKGKVSMPDTKYDYRTNSVSVLPMNEKTFYVNIEETTAYYEQIKLAMYYNVGIVFTRNKLEEKVVQEDFNAIHISNFNEVVDIDVNVRNLVIKNDVEERVMYILKIISNAFDFHDNIFQIGDVETIKRVKINDEQVMEEEIKAIACALEGTIYIQRELIKQNSLGTVRSKNLTNIDRKFICNNLDTIAHELAHVIYGTIDNTQAHAEAQIIITNKLLKMMY
jgi:hypothetical protein